MIISKGIFTKEDIINLLNTGHTVENFVGGFIVTDENVLVDERLPYSTRKTFEQVGDEVENITEETLSVSEYFSTKKTIDGMQYIYAQVKTSSSVYKSPTSEELQILIEMFGIDNLVTKSEWQDLQEEVIE